MRLTLNYLLQVRYAAVASLGLANQGLLALRALNFYLRAVFQQVQLHLLFGHLFCGASHRALFRASVNLVARAVKFQVLYQIPILVQLATRLLLLLLCLDLGILSCLLLIFTNPFRFW